MTLNLFGFFVVVVFFPLLLLQQQHRERNLPQLFTRFVVVIVLFFLNCLFKFDRTRFAFVALDVVVQM